MQTLFTSYDDKASFPLLHANNQDYILRSYRRDLNKMVNYYRASNYSVKSNHLLCRIITTCSTSIDLDIEHYMKVINARSAYVAKHYFLTSPLQYGRIHYGTFGNENTPHILVDVSNYFNIFLDYQKDDLWKRLCPVKCIGHEDSSMNIHLPDGGDHTTSRGTMYYTIDIPLLMFMYRQYIVSALSKREGVDTNTNIGHFVKAYVLPNLAYSYTDLMFVNRLNNLLIGRPMDAGTSKLPIAIIDYRDVLDKSMIMLINRVKNKRMNYAGYLRSIPTITADNGQLALQLPELPPVRQCNWMMLCSRLKACRMLIAFGGDEGRKSNLSLLTALRIEFKQLMRSRELETVLRHFPSTEGGHTFFDDVMIDINAIGIAN